MPLNETYWIELKVFYCDQFHSDSWLIISQNLLFGTTFLVIYFHNNFPLGKRHEGIKEKDWNGKKVKKTLSSRQDCDCDTYVTVRCGAVRYGTVRYSILVRRYLITGRSPRGPWTVDIIGKGSKMYCTDDRVPWVGAGLSVEKVQLLKKYREVAWVPSYVFSV